MFTFFAKAQSQISIGSTIADEEFFDSKYTNDGGTINVGRITTNGDADCYIVKLNSARQIIWQKRIPNVGDDYLTKVQECANGNYVAVGKYTINNRGRGLVCRFNNIDGTIIWSTTSVATGSVNGDAFWDVKETINGNIATVGPTDYIAGSVNGIIVLLNATGVEVWSRMYNYAQSDIFTCINQLPNGNLIVGGFFFATNNDNGTVIELNETSAAVQSQNQYSINLNNPNPLGLNTLNSLNYPNCSVVGNDVYFSYNATNGCCGANNIQAIYSYNQISKALSGNLFHHTGFSNPGTKNFSLIGQNDFIITQSIVAGGNTNNNFVSRVTNGQINYDRRILNTARNINGINIRGNNLNLIGNINQNVGDGYSIFSAINFPVTTSGCNINNADSLVMTPNAPTNTPNTTALINRTIMTTLILTNIDVNAVVLNLCVPAVPCPNDTTVTKNKCINQSIQLSARAGTTYSWSPSIGLSATNIQNPICTVNSNSTYTCTITNAVTNCTYRDIINVIVNPGPISNMPDASLCLGEALQLNAPTGYTSYSWSPATNINNATISNPIVAPLVTTTYTVTITNGFGCSITDDVLVTVNDCHCEDPCSWSLTGNLIVKPINFIGSINNADFKVRTNNTQRMVVTAGGNIGLNIATPSKTLDVNGEAVVRTLPAANPNDRLVLANTTGELKSLAPGTTGQYLSGNGTWQTLPVGGGTVTGADQGVTLDGSTVQLGDKCSNGGGKFRSNREVNINDYNLHFNTSYKGKVRIGNNIFKERYCPELDARLEISTRGLETKNDYISQISSPSGLRFTDLTALERPIDNKYNGVLSLDEDGDVIWVNACCNQAAKDNQITSILERLDKLESELKTVKGENAVLKSKLNQTEVTLDYKKNLLEQNVPNPFTETTTIGYTIVNSFSKAVIVFSAANGEVIKSVQLNNFGKGQVNISAGLVAKGIYSYSLIVDGKLIETKKMIKE